MARNPGRTVFIGNLDEKVSERVLYEILIQAGHVVGLHVPSNKESNSRKGYAFAEYETEDIAQYAVRLFSGLVRINGKTLKFVVGFHFYLGTLVVYNILPTSITCVYTTCL
ncbi:RNA-binding (RRM/RBD/RNP motifs) family protein [Zea mays]|uniref:RNA-binding (RRM/RBD/RNP motifs) family protein n=1 Tax=Zea mays TaxID=4577 RepID=A0A1D6N5R3_MAIZE|nr:RNA-binding (RRM/RBD/RNP motifs) family protein [Zea mays]